MSTDYTVYSEADLKLLAACVQKRILALGKPYVVAPTPEQYEGRRLWDPVARKFSALRVDVDVGSTIVTFWKSCSSNVRPNEKGRRHFAFLAARIVAHLEAVCGNDAAFDRLRKISAAVEYRLRIAAMSIVFLAARFRPHDLSRPSSYWRARFEIRIGILDDFLMPCEQRVAARMGASIGQQLESLNVRQHWKLANKQEAKKNGHVLLIESSALHALNACGGNVDEVVRVMLDAEHPHIGEAREVPLTCDEREFRLHLVIRNGRIFLEASAEGLLRLWDRKLIIPGSIPLSVASSRIGLPLRRLIDHPLLRGGTRIENIVVDVGISEIMLQSDVIGISADEVPCLATVINSRSTRRVHYY